MDNLDPEVGNKEIAPGVGVDAFDPSSDSIVALEDEVDYLFRH